MFNKRLKQLAKDVAVSAVLVITTFGQNVHAQEAAGESQFWELYEKLQQGLFFLGIFVALFGLYLTLLKKEDVGKKLVVGSIGAYVLSFLVPQLFILVRNTLGR